MNVSIAATRKALIAAPSPLEGEGYSVVQHNRKGEGSRAERATQNHPSPHSLLLRDRAALSLKGRGHSDVRPSRCANKGAA